MSYSDVTRLRFATVAGPGSACHVAARRYQPDRLPPPHTHDFAEVFWIEQGTGQHDHGGVRRRFGPGTLVFVAANDVHAFAADGPRGFRIVNVAFPVSTWRHLVRRYLGRDGDWLAREPGARSFSLEPGELEVVRIAARELLDGARDRFALERFLMNLIHLVRRRAPIGASHHMPPWLRHAVARTREPSVLEGGVSGFVALCGRSAEHVARETRRWLGRSPTELVNDARMDQAAHMLANDDRSVVDVALSVGLSNVSHFYRLFRARFGLAPAAFREAQRRVLGQR